MRKSITAFFCILSLSAFSQNTDPTTVHQSLNGTLVEFNFKSNKLLDEFIEAKWESRFMTIHPDLVEFDIDPDTQMVRFTIDSEVDYNTVDTITKRFDIINYTISE